MLSYNDALELKERGFPQGDELYCACAFTTEEERKELDMDVVYDCQTERVYKPTLEELIESCGDKMVGLIKHDDGSGWTAVKNGDTLFTPDLKENDKALSTGSTPSQAVKNLWIALNKKV